MRYLDELLHPVTVSFIERNDSNDGREIDGIIGTAPKIAKDLVSLFIPSVQR